MPLETKLKIIDEKKVNLLEKIGAGSFGQVFLAELTKKKNVKIKVAVKVSEISN